MSRPKVGIGVIIQNREGKVLVGKRKGSHAPYYSIPGGHLEEGETFEEAAIKEVWEETGLRINSPKVVSVTNNLNTYKEEGKHYISINLYTDDFTGIPSLKEADKCEGWYWMHPDEIPSPHFDASELALKCFLTKKFYLPNQE